MTTVVGKGPAGLLTAALLAEDGDAVTVVADHGGTLPLWSGRLDFRGRDHGRPIEDPWAWWAAHGDVRWPGAGARARWETLWRWVAKEMAALGTGDGTVPALNRWTLTAMGRLRTVFWAPVWEWVFQDPPPAVFVECVGVLDMAADFLADRYRSETGAPGYAVRLPRPPDWAPTWNALRWALFLDGQPGLRWMEDGETVGALPVGAIVVVPPILGIEREPEVRRRLQARVGAPVRELSLPPPGVGGLRVQRRWERRLADRGVVFWQGRVVAEEGGRLVLDDGRTLAASSVVWATGGVMGGGLRVDEVGTVRDSVNGDVVATVAEEAPVRALTAGWPPDGPRVVAGRQVGDWDPAEDWDGGALVVWTAACAAERVRPGLVERLDPAGGKGT
jgi:glycerol-3-phosphate dehydrogenase subunit B